MQYTKISFIENEPVHSNFDWSMFTPNLSWIEALDSPGNRQSGSPTLHAMLLPVFQSIVYTAGTCIDRCAWLHICLECITQDHRKPESVGT